MNFGNNFVIFVRINICLNKFTKQFGCVIFSKVTFVLNNPFSNIRVLEDNSVFINDIDGNCFKIPDVAKLDAQSLRRIEIYL